MSDHANKKLGLTPKDRQSLFLELAGRVGGTTAQEVYDRASEMGDVVTVEAFHNLGRRLAHRGILVSDKKERHTRYSIGANVDGQWLDEEQLAAIINPDYPLIALTALKESLRQLHSIPESVWIELRERLKHESAPSLFCAAIMDYSDNLRDELQNYIIHAGLLDPQSDLPKLRQEIENLLALLNGLTKFGLGLSEEAIDLPSGVDAGLAQVRNNPEVIFYDKETLEEEINRRVSAENIVVPVDNSDEPRDLLVAAVDGSTRGGLLSFQGEAGDLAVGHSPMVSINTSVAQINRSVQVGQQMYPAFMRLPEKPEDMQQQANRYTIMAKLFYPDLSDAEYAHSLWNAMDALESKATLRVMSRWYTSKANMEIMPADVVMKDGTITPQDRDFSHYKDQNSYGRIVRDLIEINWEIAKKCREDGQTFSGVVKSANLRVFAPVINWYMCKLAAKESNSQLIAWPLRAMNLMTDQMLLTRILTAGSKKSSQWNRTCLALRPFHATTNFAKQYSRKAGKTPADQIMMKAKTVRDDMGKEERWFWDNFRGEKDVYVQMLKNVWYAGFYLGCLPRLDIEKMLPRYELLVAKSTDEAADGPTEEVKYHLQNLLDALRKMGFDVSDEHSMFASAAQLDVLPTLTIKAHETVKIWATELLSRVQEYIGYHLSRYFKGDTRGVRIRQWNRRELEGWVAQMHKERNLAAGAIVEDGNALIESNH